MEGILLIIGLIAIPLNIWLIVKFASLCSDVRDIEWHQRNILSRLDKWLGKGSEEQG
jgi:hypothetical protein